MGYFKDSDLKQNKQTGYPFSETQARRPESHWTEIPNDKRKKQRKL